MTTPDPITPERVTLTEGDLARMREEATSRVRDGDQFAVLDGLDTLALLDEINRLSDHIEQIAERAAQADAWDEGAVWAGAIRLDGIVSHDNPYRETP